jgi:hypothetical protein
MSSGKHKISYPVARPFTPPAEHEPPKAQWAGLVALAGLVAFLCAGLILLINCLQPEADTPKTESPSESEQAGKEVGGFKLGVNMYAGEPAIPTAPNHEALPNQEQEPPQKDQPRAVIGHDVAAPPKESRPRTPDLNPLLKLEPAKQPAAIPPAVPRPRTPDEPKHYISGLPSLLPNEKSFILGPLDVPKDGTLKFSTIAVQTDAKPMRLAITPPHYDDMGQLLTKLGEGYRYTQLTEADLGNLAKLKQFNVLFLTCASNYSDLRAVSAVNRFVEMGGTLYASDLRYDLLARAFPEAANPRLAMIGDAQNIRAKVTDAGLRRILGDEILLRFDAGGWRPAAFQKRSVTTYLEGAIQTHFSKPILAPLMVKFKVKKGIVIFTAFHNAVQNDDAQLKLLQYMVFSAVNAHVEAALAKTMQTAGLTPRETKTLNISAGESLVPQTHACAKAGKLQLGVGFAGEGAKLRLLVTGPGGEKIAHEDTAGFILEIENAPAGEWRYAVAAVDTPYPNFPYTLMIGEAR